MNAPAGIQITRAWSRGRSKTSSPFALTPSGRYAAASSPAARAATERAAQTTIDASFVSDDMVHSGRKSRDRSDGRCAIASRRRPARSARRPGRVVERVLAEHVLAALLDGDDPDPQRRDAEASKRVDRLGEDELAALRIDGDVREPDLLLPERVAEDEVESLARRERRGEARDDEIVLGGDGAGDAPAVGDAIFAKVQSFAGEAAEVLVADDDAQEAAPRQRAGRRREVHHPRETATARIAAEEMLLERRFGVGGELAEPVVGEDAERVRRRAARRTQGRPSPASRHARSRPSARWRMTRTLPAASPSSVAISSDPLSATKVITTTLRSRSARSSRQARSRSESISSAEPRLSSSGSPAAQRSNISCRRASPRRRSRTTCRHVPSTNEAIRSGSRTRPERRLSIVMRSTCCARSAAAWTSRRWRKP